MKINAMALIGTGVMGMGIAQIAAQSGVSVRLYDSKQGAAELGLARLTATLQTLQTKGKITVDELESTLAHFEIVDSIEKIAGVDVVIEAIIENLEIKQALFQQLENIVATDTILATNTSSLSVTAIASALKYPERVAGFHFFNPVPLMKIVEVIQGLVTSASVMESLIEFAQHMGHRAVRTKDTPGFIVNHAGRAYGTEALKALGEVVASVSSIDRILRDGAGFRMGPFELFDLTALDVSHPVMESIFNQYYQEDRYRPHPLTRQMLSAKKVGRKVGEGFYRYIDGVKSNEQALQHVPQINTFQSVWIGADREDDAQQLFNYLQDQQIEIDTASEPHQNSLIILATYGEDTTTASLRWKVDPKRTVNIDLITDFNQHRTLMPSIVTDLAYIQQAHAIFAKDGQTVSVIEESIGFIAQRVLAMVVNLACDLAQQGIATANDIDQAVKLGLGYPHGPISWGDLLGADRILLILQRIYALTGDQRYRPSPWLQRRAKLGVSLLEASKFELSK